MRWLESPNCCWLLLLGSLRLVGSLLIMVRWWTTDDVVHWTHHRLGADGVQRTGKPHNSPVEAPNTILRYKKLQKV